MVSWCFQNEPLVFFSLVQGREMLRPVSCQCVWGQRKMRFGAAKYFEEWWVWPLLQKNWIVLYWPRTSHCLGKWEVGNNTPAAEILIYAFHSRTMTWALPTFLVVLVTANGGVELPWKNGMISVGFPTAKSQGKLIHSPDWSSFCWFCVSHGQHDMKDRSDDHWRLCGNHCFIVIATRQSHVPLFLVAFGLWKQKSKTCSVGQVHFCRLPTLREQNTSRRTVKGTEMAQELHITYGPGVPPWLLNSSRFS